MILFAHFIRENGRLKSELRDLRTSYESMTAAYYEARGELDLYADKPNYRQAIIQLDAAVTERAALRESLAQMQELADRCADERDDARREVDEVRAALCWLEDKWFKKGGVA